MHELRIFKCDGLITKFVKQERDRWERGSGNPPILLWVVSLPSLSTITARKGDAGKKK